MTNCPKRILIVGDAGRGKTTLAEKLSTLLNIPKHSTDDYFYEVKYSVPRDRQQALDSISVLYEDDRWIVEGTTQWLWRPGLEKADIILFLSHGSIISQWAILFKRYVRREGQETLGQFFALMKHVFYKRYGIGYRKGKETHAQIIAPYTHKVVRLNSFKEISGFVKKLCK